MVLARSLWYRYNGFRENPTCEIACEKHRKVPHCSFTVLCHLNIANYRGLSMVGLYSCFYHIAD